MQQVTHVDIVVARYNEDVSWLQHALLELFKCYPRLHVTVFIYNKGQSNPLIKDIGTECRVINLPNIGRESHTYLYHLVSQYERLVALKECHSVVFLQGSLHDHLPHYECSTEGELLVSFVYDTLEYGASISYADKHIWAASNSGARNFNIAMHGGRRVTPRAGMSFGDWFEKHVQSPFPSSDDHIHWWIAALFCVHSSRLVTRPKDYYIGLLNQLNTPNSELCHFLERAWIYVTNAV